MASYNNCNDHVTNEVHSPTVNDIDKESDMNSSTLYAGKRNSGSLSVLENNRMQRPTIFSNLASSTVTIVRERCKPLILKLRSPNHNIFGLGFAIKPEADIEKMVKELGDELVDSITAAVNNIRDQVKRARPHPDEENYEQQMRAYQDLLRYVTQMINCISEAFTESLANYRTLIDELWNKIQSTYDENGIQYLIQTFSTQSEKMFSKIVSEKIERRLKEAEDRLSNLKSLSRST